MSYGKYADIPVSPYTGTANPTIPLHTLNEGPLSLPIYLQYHTGGLPVGTPAGLVGLGWNLNAGGFISRTVRGLPDEGGNGYYNNGRNIDPSDNMEIALGNMDGEPDIFTYSVGGVSGKFVFDNNQEIISIPKSDNRIEPLFENGTSGSLMGFIITTTDGVRYIFGTNPDDIWSVQLRERHSTTPEAPNQTVGWFLWKIESHDQRYSIELTYERSWYRYRNPPVCADLVKIRESSGYVRSVNPCGTPAEVYNYFQSWVPKTITSQYDTITFNTNLRTDLEEHPTGSMGGFYPLRITGLNIDRGNYCQKWDFTQGYFKDSGSTTAKTRLRLDRVRRLSCQTGGDSEPPWQLFYAGTKNSDGSDFFPSIDDKNIDHWGYYNYDPAKGDNNSLDHLTPSSGIYANSYISYGSANRNTRESPMLNGMLNKIQFPTGGSLELEYEANRYYWQSSTVTALDMKSCDADYCGGNKSKAESITLTNTMIEEGDFELCLIAFDDAIPNNGYDPNNNMAKIEVFDGSNNLIQTRSFNSPDDACISGRLKYLNLGTTLYPGQTYRYKVTSLNCNATFRLTHPGNGGNRLAGGLRITKKTISDDADSENDMVTNYEYLAEGSSTQSSGKLYAEPIYVYKINPFTVLFTSGSARPLSGFGADHVGYERVIISSPGNGQIITKFNVEDYQSNFWSQYPVAPARYKVEAGQIKESKTYNETGTEVASTSSIRYSSDNYEMIGATGGGQGSIVAAAYIRGYDGSRQVDLYPYITYQLRTSVYRPGSVTTSVDGISTTQSFEYHTNNLLPDAIETANSNGEKYRQETVFISNYGITALRDEMVARNLITWPSQVSIFHEGVKIDGATSYYRFYDASGVNRSTSNGTGKHPRLYRTYKYSRTFDAAGNILSGANKLQFTYWTYTPDGQPKTFQQSNWAMTTIEYANRLPVSKTFEEHRTQNVYEYGSNILSATINVDGTQTSYTYDDLLRLESVSDDCRGVTTSYDYRFVNGGSFFNYVEVTTDYGSATDPFSDVDLIVTRTYKDGLGRDVQTVNLNSGPNTDEDIVSGVKYDQYGRVTQTYTPQAVANNNGAYRSPGASWGATTTTYEDSPLGRRLSVTPPDWHATTFAYGKNDSGDNVKVGATSTYYPNGTLTKFTVTDGNGNKLITFTDKRGQRILSRRTDAIDNMNSRLDTYYLYDAKGRTVEVIPPGASSSSTSELTYRYLYDRNDQVIEKKIPGREKIEYKYDTRDLLAASRDGELRNQNKWYAYNYDIYGRTKTEGFFTGSMPTTIGALSISHHLIKNTYGTNSHDKDKLTTIETRILGSNDWLATTNNYNTCGLLENQTGNNHLNLGASETTTYTYDAAGNITTSSYQHQGPSNSHTIKEQHYYDFAGRNSKNFFRIDNGTNHQLNAFEYNVEGQVKTKYQGGTGMSGTLAFLQKVDYDYLANGMLEGINLNPAAGKLTGSQVALPVDGGYATAPSPALPSSSANYDERDLFQLQLYRDTKAPGTHFAGRKNGDIVSVASQVRGRRQQVWTLGYDIYDRLESAWFYQREDAHDSAPLLYNHYRENIFNYGDQNVSDKRYNDRGNIKGLYRLGSEEVNGRWYQRTIDRLEYVYKNNNSNQLSHVKEIGDARTDLGYRGSYSTFDYNKNGSLTIDPGRNIRVIYNHLDLPEEIIWTNGQKLIMTYDAGGTLLARKQVDSDGNVLETRAYVGGIEYVDRALNSIYHREGLVKFTGNNEEWQYILTDHLGNTRLVYADNVADGIIDVTTEIIQESHYYPLGMRMEGPWMGATPATAYQYNGIEHVDAFDLNVNMALYRTLDPTLGRWWQVDPKAEALYSLNPYNSMANSPMVYSDPAGDFITWGLSGGGFSIGVNFTPIGIPLGGGINVGWGNGFSAGVYGEVGLRVGGSGFGSGATASVGVDYNFGSKSFTGNYGAGVYASYGAVNAGANVSNAGWGVSAGVGFGNDASGIGFNVGFGSDGFTYGVGGYYNGSAYDGNPTYEPDEWNDGGSIQGSNNCYSYACESIDGVAEERGAQPGLRSGEMINNLELETVINAAVRDGTVKKPNFWNKLGFGKRDYYNVYLVVDDTGPIQDYHWYRQDSNGRWSHKPGLTPVTNLDASGRIIRNPARANRNYGSYGGGTLNYNQGILLWARK